MHPIRPAGLLAAMTVLLAACGTESTDLDGPYDLVVRGSADFGEPHGGQPIEVALVDEEGRVKATRSGVVSATADPSFQFDFPEELLSGRVYSLRYWIDSNIEGGDEGECDPPEIDHQWRFQIAVGYWNVEWTAVYDVGLMADVCDTF
ncbi:MAG: hypothetical protein PVI57_06970 [Gemmatimonadota bacterium]|jgi:hypothetical protein